MLASDASSFPGWLPAAGAHVWFAYTPRPHTHQHILLRFSLQRPSASARTAAHTHALRLQAVNMGNISRACAAPHSALAALALHNAAAPQII